ncbi:MAG TPA: hypothetical protein DCZ91_25915 [Lachnospiraceae bacterium]|nr:hypothetical protein [Lachnospiraceae bacterium]
MRRLSYKYVISMCILGLIGIMLIAFSAYSFYNYRRECQEIAGREADATAAAMVSQIDERLDNLKQYYISFAGRDDFKWVLEENMHYSDYSQYTAVTEIMSGNKIFMDYISSYLFLNSRTGWVLGSGGMFPMSELDGGSILYDFFQRNNEAVDRNYWLYNESLNTEIVGNRKYRLSVSEGLSLVMRMPTLSVRPYSIFVVNINMDTWEKWIIQQLSSYEDVVILDEDGEVVYFTDEGLVESCKRLQIQGNMYGASQKIRSSRGTEHMVSFRSSGVLGWKYYICYDINKGQFELVRFSGAFLFLLLIFVAVALFLTSYAIYRPFGRLVYHVSEDREKVRGNELEFLAGRFADMKKDRQVLEVMMEQQREELLELFELRMIRGEVCFDEEWEEYISNLHLKPQKFFAAAIIVMNLGEENGSQSDVKEDVLCLEFIKRMPEDLRKMAWLPIVYNACAVFALFSQENEDALLEQMLAFYDGIQTFSRKQYGYGILMGISATHTDYRDVREAYRESVSALTMDAEEDEDGKESRKTAHEDCRFFLSNPSMRINAYDTAYEKEMRNSVKALDREQCYKVIDEFTDYLRKCNSQDEAAVYILRMVNVIHIAAIAARLDVARLYPDGIRKVYYEIIEVTELSRVRRCMKRLLIDPILDARSRILKENSRYMLQEIERKIEESRGNITLAECAEALGVHPTYVWKVLKAEKGKSFLDYLEAYKLEESKRLLLQTDLTVAEIAAELNYTNAQNFIRFFSKNTGITPGRFRKLS